MTTALVKGSLQDTMDRKRITVADAMLDVELVVVLDCSGSMNASVTNSYQGGYRTKRQVATRELETLQNDKPGRVALVTFSDDVEFQPSGRPPNAGGCTSMHRALKFVKDLDDIGMKLCLISDGGPTDATPEEVVKLAATFKSGISTIYIGPETDKGAELMRRIAEVSGGAYGGAREVRQLCQTIKLLTA